VLKTLSVQYTLTALEKLIDISSNPVWNNGRNESFVGIIALMQYTTISKQKYFKKFI
jgi:hypothetical protein